MFYLSTLFLKIKKNLLIFLFIITLFGNFILGYLYWNPKTNSPKQNSSARLKVATALPTVNKFLSEDVKQQLEKYNIDLEVIYFPHQYEKTNELLINEEVDAKYDSHVHMQNDTNNKILNNDKKSTLIQTGYLAKFGLYAKKGSFESLYDIQKTTHPNALNILIGQERYHKDLTLHFLSQLDIIKAKANFQTDFEKKPFNLETDKFETNATKYPTIVFHTGELMSLKNKFQNDSTYDLCANYPTIMGTDYDVKRIETLQKPKNLEDPIYSYTISLYARENNKNYMPIKILQQILQQQNIIQKAQDGLFKDNVYMINSNEVNQLTQIIQKKYLIKTLSSN